MLIKSILKCHSASNIKDGKGSNDKKNLELFRGSSFQKRGGGS